MASRKNWNKNLQEKTGLILPIGRINHHLAKGPHQPSSDKKLKLRILTATPIYVTAVIEYLVSEILEISGYIAQSEKRPRILPRHLLLAMQNDEELKNLFASLSPELVQKMGGVAAVEFGSLANHSEENMTTDVATIKLEDIPEISKDNKITDGTTIKLEDISEISATTIKVEPFVNIKPKKNWINNLQEKTGLILPIGRINHHLVQGPHQPSSDKKLKLRIPIDTPIYVTAVIEYLVSEILEISGYFAQSEKRPRILPRHLILAMQNDEELKNLLASLSPNLVQKMGGVAAVEFESLANHSGENIADATTIPEISEGNKTTDATTINPEDIPEISEDNKTTDATTIKVELLVNIKFEDIPEKYMYF
ncbi:11550_t:CDS:2 [Ambispora gerdemannii]|uniref:11550_t:CDS:1 n=1 Tax=Ambispora gerdemannii TaxID=144530 RepID=A0A9N8Z122_9GLOM|nr:11550_t:CDS:2 [Ambispora gerdemannii]